jgi:hypothetical protein
MTLVITAVAALFVTILRFTKPQAAERWRLGVLALVLWGASLMWTVDLIATTAAGEAFIDLSDSVATLDDALLGLCVLALALFVWFVVRLMRRHKAEVTA